MEKSSLKKRRKIVYIFYAMKKRKFEKSEE